MLVRRLQPRLGSTLVLVTIVGVLLTLITLRTLGVGREDDSQRLLMLRCERGAERLRGEVLEHLDGKDPTAPAWLQAVRGELAGEGEQSPCPGTPGQGPRTWEDLPGIQVWIDQVSVDNRWVELVAASSDGASDLEPASVRVRLSFADAESAGHAQIFGRAGKAQPSQVFGR
jgi:hypothetical protein